MMMNKFVPSDSKAHMVEAWAKAWAITRGVAPPVKDHEGFRIDPCWPKQLRRYVFTEINEGFKILSGEISDPWIFLKVCAAPELVKAWLPDRWVMEAPRFMMVCSAPMHRTGVLLPDEYVFVVEKEAAVSIVRIKQKEMTVAIGRVVVVDGWIIYDRIETMAEHRRKGLATLMMLKLEAIGLAEGGEKGVLVATAEGKKLYENLGWEMYSAYTTAVIRGLEDISGHGG